MARERKRKKYKQGRVVIGVARCGPPTWMLLQSLMTLRAPAPGYKIAVNPKAVATDIARNWIGKEFCENPQYSDGEWLLWIDSDAEVHPDTLMRLLSWGKPIVGALTFAPGAPVTPAVFKGPGDGTKRAIPVHAVYRWIADHPALHTHHAAIVEPRPPDALYGPVDFTGCHCLLIHRNVLETVEFPWFRATLDRSNQEDRYFCEKAQAAGFEVWVDFSVVAGHSFGDRRPCGALDFIAWYAISEFEEVRKHGEKEAQA